MTDIPFYWVDAFTDRPFGGNPAAVCPLEAWLPDAQLQQMARQHGLSETAFFVGRESGDYQLRWFTPAREVDLCGHATLATAHVLYEELGYSGTGLRFASRSGELRVTRGDTERLELDFPARPPQTVAAADHAPALAALGVDSPVWIGKARDLLVVLDTTARVRALRPDVTALRRTGESVIVTARGEAADGCDFVSRFFAPSAGIDEDPVTGSAHCTLVPYWAERLGRSELRARQISDRSGELWCRLEEDRVHLAGHAVTYLRGLVRLK